MQEEDGISSSHTTPNTLTQTSSHASTAHPRPLNETLSSANLKNFDDMVSFFGLNYPFHV